MDLILIYNPLTQCLSMDPHVTLISFSEKTSIGGASLSMSVDPAVFINQDFLTQHLLTSPAAPTAAVIEFIGGSDSAAVADKKLTESIFTEQDSLREKVRDLAGKVIQLPPAAAAGNNSSSASNYSSSSTTYPPYGERLTEHYYITNLHCIGFLRIESNILLICFLHVHIALVPLPSYAPDNTGSGSGLLPPPQRVPPAVGDGDLHPFPMFLPGVAAPARGSGSLVGPDHPLFTGTVFAV
jgi:hypothetical protein